MQPFIWKVGNFSADVFPTDEEMEAFRARRVKGEVTVLEEEVGVERWLFLRDWKTPVVEETLEKLSKRGADDSEVRPPLLFVHPSSLLIVFHRSTSVNTSANNSDTYSRPLQRGNTTARRATRNCLEERSRMMIPRSRTTIIGTRTDTMYLTRTPSIRIPGRLTRYVRPSVIACVGADLPFT